MPFCNQCGTPVQPSDRYCAKCGGLQPNTAANAGGGPAPDPFNSITPRNAALLCYIPFVGWIWAIVVLAATRYRSEPETRFHAFQGLFLFVVWLLVDWFVSPMFGFSMPHEFGLNLVPKVLKLAILGAWIFMIIKTAHGEMYRLPVLGELADRSVSEQR